MLHGCTQDPDDFAIGTGMNDVAEEHGLIVAYPAQSRSANPSLCWNWFDRKDQKRGSGEPAIIAGLTEQLVAEFGIGRGRVFIAGLSAGGAMAAIMGGAYPDIYAAVGIYSGLEFGSVGDLVSALAAMRGDERRHGSVDRSRLGAPGRIIVFHGEADQTVHFSNGDSIVAAAKAGLESTRRKNCRVARPVASTIAGQLSEMRMGFRLWSTGAFTRWVTPGPAVVRMGPIPTRADECFA